mmetsp:Transcript_15374/g.22630  ORF Transcript_15374/g.22630 Transcript_15374/m.22630 type:complete len:191 (-) Transcript_15374:81-653(-)
MKGAFRKHERAHERKQREYQRKLHLKRLSNVKSSIDNKPPKKHSHLRKNLKKKQQMEERFARIERENQLLLEKMSYIMSSSSLDNKNKSLKYARSMNKQIRKKNLEKITRENQAILERIQAKEPVYSQVKWEHERQQQVKYLRNLSDFGGSPQRRKELTRLEPMDEEYQREAREYLDGTVNAEDDHFFMP